MRILTWEEAQKAEKYFTLAWEIAQNATCERSKCWCVIVKNDKIIWEWWNTPPKDLESQRRCTCDKST